MLMVTRWEKKLSSGFQVESLYATRGLKITKGDFIMDGDTPKLERGFRLMLPERQREIASSGGKRAHELGKAHRWNSETGREAAAKRKRAGRRPKITLTSLDRNVEYGKENGTV